MKKKWCRISRLILAMVAGSSILFSGLAWSEPEPEELPMFSGNVLPEVGKTLGCAIVGVATCVYLGSRDDELSLNRSAQVREFQISYFPSYVLDLAESKAFQRIEGAATLGNVVTGVSHRRGVSEPNEFSSTSLRVGYSFDWRHLQPAFGLGYRRNVNARNGDAFEIWFPVYTNRAASRKAEDDFSIYFETIWIVGRDGVRPDIQARFEFPLGPNLLIATGLGYFADYHNPEAELSIGPTFIF